MSPKQTARIAPLLFLLASLAACTSFPYTTPAPAGTPEPPAAQTPIATVAASQPETTTSQTLRIWLPAEFDPAADTAAGILLQARLDEFRSRRPNLNVEVRVKALAGPAGLLNALTSTSQAAPSILPDLIALPVADLEIAA
ncbi:MAG: hypothetical protein L3J16_07315, partial [Anaerolineales bacterium]|nr:hypothetical protein [Anaerolineales bacterium]